MDWTPPKVPKADVDITIAAPEFTEGEEPLRELIDTYRIPGWVLDVIRNGRAGTAKKGDDSYSAWMFKAVRALIRLDVPDEIILGLLVDQRWGISAHILKDEGRHGDEDKQLVYAERQIKQAHAAIKAEEEERRKEDSEMLAEPSAQEAKDSRNKRPRYKAYQVWELAELPPVDWLIDGLMPERGLTVIYGPTKEHKTFVALDQALCVATGIDYCGRAVKQQRVLYIIAEGQSDFYNRIKAWCSAHDMAIEDLDGRFEVIQIKVDVDTLVADKNLREALFAPNPGPYGLVFVDTVNRNMAGDESGTSEMSQFVKGCEVIRDHYEVTVTAIHHTGWERKRMRGNTALPSAADANIRVEKDKKNGGRTTLTVEEARFGPDGWSLQFQPRHVVTDYETGRYSLVMEWLEGEEAPKTKCNTLDELLVRIAEAGEVPSRVDLRDPDTHGFSKANVDKNINKLLAFHWITEGDVIKATKEGHDEALMLGAVLPDEDDE